MPNSNAPQRQFRAASEHSGWARQPNGYVKAVSRRKPKLLLFCSAGHLALANAP